MSASGAGRVVALAPVPTKSASDSDYTVRLRAEIDKRPVFRFVCRLGCFGSFHAECSGAQGQ